MHTYAFERHGENRAQRGFTLLELMVVVTVAAVILGLAVPNFRAFMLNSRLTSAANDLLGALYVARTEAVKRQLPVAICATNDSAATPPACSGAEYRSWVVWVDADDDWVPDAANEPVLVRQAALDAQVLVRVAAGESGVVKYMPSGFASPPGAGFVPSRNVVICDERGTAAVSAGTSAARALLITQTGRARVTREKTEIDTALANVGGTCP